FITFKDSPDQLEIVGDDKGIRELIEYLQGVRTDKDHMHLTIDTELDAYPITGDRKGKTLFAKHVRLEYNDTEEWIGEDT
ncbi:MAG: hypothetical protein AB3N14_16690, partial [Flavobacteriaceae bacterium]